MQLQWSPLGPDLYDDSKDAEACTNADVDEDNIGDEIR